MTIPNERISDKLHEPVRFLVFSASLREASLNSQLARLAARVIEQHGGKVDLAAMADFDVPSYDQDTHDAGGIPAGGRGIPPPPGSQRRLRHCLA
jgi:chromate reductase